MTWNIILSKRITILFMGGTLSAFSGVKDSSESLHVVSGTVVPSSSGEDQRGEHKDSRPRSPGCTPYSSRKRRSLPTSHEAASKENSSGNSSSSGNNKTTVSQADLHVQDVKSRKYLYAALQRNEHDVVKTLLMFMVLNKQMGARGKLADHYQMMKELLPRFNDILIEGQHPFPGHTYVDMLCAVPVWHDALMGIFFDELGRDVLSRTPQVLRAQYYAVKHLEELLKEMIEELLLVMNAENPSLVTAGVSTLLNPKFVPQTFEQFLYEQLTAKMVSNETRLCTEDYDRSTQGVGIFEQIALIEKKGSSSALAGYAQTTSASREK